MEDINILLELAKTGGTGVAVYILYLIVKDQLAAFKDEMKEERAQQAKILSDHNEERKLFYKHATETAEKATEAINEFSAQLKNVSIIRETKK